ncbi:MAG: methionyl-tRNA formyltransferase [Pseudomarimonas sp.]
MRVVFAGTPAFAVPCLLALLRSGVEVAAVYTQPDRPLGRGRRMEPSPVKQAAQAAGIEVRQPERLRGREVIAALRELKPDLLVVVAYGLLLPQAVLDIPRFGCWNVHASLLPRWRGAAPIQRAIEAGDAQTGVCLMRMEKGLDTGPVLLQLSAALTGKETSGALHDRLSLLGAEVLTDGVGLLRAGLVPQARAQSEAGVTYASKLEKSEARLDWSQDAVILERKVRAFLPWPVAEAEVAGERVRIHRAEVISSDQQGSLPAPGNVTQATALGIDIACGSGVLRLLDVQREGGRVVSARDYLNARPALRP